MSYSNNTVVQKLLALTMVARSFLASSLRLSANHATRQIGHLFVGSALLIYSGLASGAVYEFRTDQTLASQGWLPEGQEQVLDGYIEVGSLIPRVCERNSPPPHFHLSFEFRLKMVDYQALAAGSCFAHPLVMSISITTKPVPPAFCGRRGSSIIIYDADNTFHEYFAGPLKTTFTPSDMKVMKLVPPFI